MVEAIKLGEVEAAQRPGVMLLLRSVGLMRRVGWTSPSLLRVR